MAQYELLLPKMGESVAEATIIKWVKQVGDTISLDDTILEIATDKVDSEVPSPVSGKLVKQLCAVDDIVQVGAVIAIIETDSDNNSSNNSLSNETPSVAVSSNQVEESLSSVSDIPGISAVVETTSNNYKSTDRFYSPLVKKIAQEENISLEELSVIKGTGAEGRVTKDDMLNYIKTRGSENNSIKSFNADQSTKDTSINAPKQVNNIDNSTAKGTSVSGTDEIIEMDRMRKLIADHMVMSKQTSPHVTSFVEADVTNLVNWRNKVKNEFEKRENEKITFTPIFVEAVARAIKDFPLINVSVNGTQIIKKKDINIGMAAALPSGNLIVPVIKNADQLNLIGLTKAVNDLASRARKSKLKPDETQNGTFTLTNVGSFGNVMGTPIINQPQVAILAVGAIKKKPAVIETEFGDVIAIRHMMYLSLSYDHRVVDGALGGSFVRRVADYLESWDINREL
ncbi:MAG: 2-oxo acid dehydrogenase subunit E2 [Pedobacter sp.]|nr:MAG: 2-oxo acid dehydrogenase subunit E2 [Pedobacter sp.]